MWDLSKIFGRTGTASKEIAKERLKLVLIHDRANVSPEILNMIKGDIIKVISSYVEIDEKELDIHLTRGVQGNENYSALVANIPIRKIKNIGKNTG